MGRVIGSKNKNLSTISLMSTQERIKLLANLIIDKILEDQKNGQKILKQISSK